MSTVAKGATETKTESPPSHVEDPIITLSEAGKLIGKSHTTIGRWIMDGLLEGIRFPSGIRGVRRSAINEILRVMKVNKED